jgi:hypothetical protein
MVIHQDAISFYPPPFPRDSQSNFRQWVEAHQDLYNRYDIDLEQIAESHRITEADGDDLDRIGAMFGPLGKRRRRGDYDYREYLTSLANTFSGRGTNEDIRFAIASGVLTDTDVITIREDTQTLSYTLQINDWEGHSTRTVDTLAQLADPSVVERVPPIGYLRESSGVGVSADDMTQGVTVTLPKISVGVRQHDIEHRTDYDDGFGAGRFDGTDEFGPSLGDQPDEDGFGQDYGRDYGE